MNDLKNHVDAMFRKYKENDKIKELKNEVLSNLEAKVKDLTESGMEYSEATRMAKESISSIDYLIDGNKKVYINKLKLEYLQIVLLYFLVGWIITIPAFFSRAGVILNIGLFISSVILGIKYIKSCKKNQPDFIQDMSFVNIQFAYRIKKITWAIWLLYIIVTTFFTTALRFASNIWFSRPVQVSGPYSFASLILEYFLPFISIIIPLVINAAPKLILRYEVGGDDEN